MDGYADMQPTEIDVADEITIDIVCPCCGKIEQAGDPRYMREWPKCKDCNEPMQRYEQPDKGTAKWFAEKEPVSLKQANLLTKPLIATHLVPVAWVNDLQHREALRRAGEMTDG